MDAQQTLRTRRKEYRAARRRLRRFGTRRLAWVAGGLVALLIVGNAINTDMNTDQPSATSSTAARPVTTRAPTTTSEPRTATTQDVTAWCAGEAFEISDIMFELDDRSATVLAGLIDGWDAAQSPYLEYLAYTDVALLKAENWITECETLSDLAPEEMSAITLAVEEFRSLRAELLAVCRQDAPSWFDCGEPYPG
ncbi:MAG: hypothetical protein F4X26_09960 [Chloroflexi bacterium]|nr:hypothetical protein [Chloroflexota bacterium]